MGVCLYSNISPGAYMRGSTVRKRLVEFFALDSNLPRVNTRKISARVELSCKHSLTELYCVLSTLQAVWIGSCLFNLVSIVFVMPPCITIHACLYFCPANTNPIFCVLLRPHRRCRPSDYGFVNDGRGGNSRSGSRYLLVSNEAHGRHPGEVVKMH